MTERFITSTLNKRDPAREMSLRPPAFADFPGQTRVKEQLELFVRAAKARDEALDHILLCGPPGLGKTTLAYIIANERGTNLKSSSGPAIEKPGDLAGLLTALEPGDVLFIDEIHRLNTTVEEYLYSAMEDFFIDIMLEQGAGARSVRLTVPHFTLIGATTRQGMISAPLRSRFGLNIRLDYYDTDSLSKILKRSAGILGIEIDDDGAREIAGRCRGTPRIANNLLRRARDYAQVRADSVVTGRVAADALEMLQIDRDEQELEIALKQRELMKYGECANCGYPVQDDYILCPSCHTRLKNMCPTCHRALDPSWTVCPYCATSLQGAPQQRRQRRPRPQQAPQAQQAEQAQQRQHPQQ